MLSSLTNFNTMLTIKTLYLMAFNITDIGIKQFHNHTMVFIQSSISMGNPTYDVPDTVIRVVNVFNRCRTCRCYAEYYRADLVLACRNCFDGQLKAIFILLIQFKSF